MTDYYYLFDFDGTLITPLEIDYKTLKNKLQVILETTNEITPMVEKIKEYSNGNEIKIKQCYELIDEFEIQSLPKSKIKYKWLDLYVNSRIKVIVSRNGNKVIEKFFKSNNLPLPDYISCRDNSTELKPSIKQLDFLETHFTELYQKKELIIMVGDTEIDKLLAENYNISIIDVNSSKLVHIDIFIPFYNHNGDIQRTHLTKKIFHHYSNLKNTLSSRAIISFSLIGSEKNISLNLAQKYFPREYYFEFNQELNQNNKQIYSDFNAMFHRKMNFGINTSINKNPDIVLCTGSNDFIPIKFFNDIIDFYTADTPQVYGIDNYNNGKNCIYFAKYNIDKEEFISNGAFWWDGISNFSGREKYNYTGGIIGVNRNLIINNQELVKTWGYDEGETERIALQTANVDKFNSRNTYFFNVKTINDKDLNTLKQLNDVGLKHIDINKDIDIDTRKNILEDIEYYKSL